MNNVSLVGRLTKDPEKRNAKNGTPCCLFQLAVNRGIKQANGDPYVDFVPCSAWAFSCEFLVKYAKKGDMISLTGRIQTRSSMEPNGQTRFIVEVLVISLAILNPKPLDRPIENPNNNATQEEDPSYPF